MGNHAEVARGTGHPAKCKGRVHMAPMITGAMPLSKEREAYDCA